MPSLVQVSTDTASSGFSALMTRRRMVSSSAKSPLLCVEKLVGDAVRGWERARPRSRNARSICATGTPPSGIAPCLEPAFKSPPSGVAFPDMCHRNLYASANSSCHERRASSSQVFLDSSLGVWVRCVPDVVHCVLIWPLKVQKVHRHQRVPPAALPQTRAPRPDQARRCRCSPGCPSTRLGCQC